MYRVYLNLFELSTRVLNYILRNAGMLRDLLSPFGTFQRLRRFCQFWRDTTKYAYQDVKRNNRKLLDAEMKVHVFLSKLCQNEVIKISFLVSAVIGTHNWRGSVCYSNRIFFEVRRWNE